jgi:hypothetical protein
MLADDPTGAFANASHVLLATSGTVVVTSVGTSAGTPVQVEIQNASFEEIDRMTYAAITTSSCPSPLAHALLDGTVVP